MLFFIFAKKSIILLVMAKLTDEQIDKRIEDYKQETKFREVQKKRKNLRKERLQKDAKRKAENKIKYILGGIILSIWGYKKVFQLFEKTKSLRPQDLEAINKFKELFAAEIEAQDKLIEQAKKENQKNAESN